jgi:hypothetical protein
MKYRWVYAVLAITVAVIPNGAGAPAPDWRDDKANIEIVRELNRAYRRVPFSTEYEGVSDNCPIEIDWTVGPDLPLPGKGSVSGLFGDEIVIAAGAWLDNKPRSLAFNFKTGSYREVAPPPMNTSFAQGTFDGKNIYLVGGKSAGRQAAKLAPAAGGTLQWTDLPPIPEQNRWTAAVNSTGDWLFLYTGRVKADFALLDAPEGAVNGQPGPLNLPAWRLRLNTPNARWEPMAAFPGRASCVLNTAVVRGKVYAFGGWHDDEALKETTTKLDLWRKYRLRPLSPTPAYVAYRDAFSYDPAANRWTRIRSLPFPMYGGSGVVVDDRYILLMGISDRHTLRVGRSAETHKPYLDQYWKGYGDMILCYDVETDQYSRVGLMLYGVSSWNWIRVGDRVYGFGGEPWHSLHSNRESVVQVGTIVRK